MNYIPGHEIKKYENHFNEEFLMSLLPEGFKFKRKPFYHQLLSLVFGLQFSQEGFGNYSEMGAGKTGVAIDYCRALGIKKNILVLTLKSIITDFVREFKACSDYSVKAFTTESKKERDKIIRENEYDVYIMNYESLLYDVGIRKKNVRDFIMPVLKDKQWEALIVDESRVIANIKSKRTQAVLWISSNSKIKLPLSGLPIAKNEYEIFTQQLLIDRGERFGISLAQFMEEHYKSYRAFWGYTEWKIKPGAAEKIHKLMYEQAIRYRKDECLSLPPVVYENRFVELEGDQREAYAFLKKQMTDDIGAMIVDSTNRLYIKKQLVRFRQICNGFVQESVELDEQGNKLPRKPTIFFKSNPKLKELLSILELLYGYKVVIFSYFKEEQRMIYDVLHKLDKNTLKMTADVDTNTFNKNKELFMTDSKYKWLVGSLEMVARGVNFTCAKYGIFYSLDFDYELIRQAEERFARPGSEVHNKITLIRLLTANTVEDRLMKILLENEAMVDKVIEGRNLLSLI